MIDLTGEPIPKPITEETALRLITAIEALAGALNKFPVGLGGIQVHHLGMASFPGVNAGAGGGAGPPANYQGK